MKIKLLKHLETNLGTIYYEREKDYIYLYDSNKSWCGTILKQAFNVEDLKNLNSASDLVELGAISGCYYANTEEELVKVINEISADYNKKHNDNEPMVNLDLLNAHNLINKIGNNYFVVYDNGYTLY